MIYLLIREKEITSLINNTCTTFGFSNLVTDLMVIGIRSHSDDRQANHPVVQEDDDVNRGQVEKMSWAAWLPQTLGWTQSQVYDNNKHSSGLFTWFYYSWCKRGNWHYIFDKFVLPRGLWCRMIKKYCLHKVQANKPPTGILRAHKRGNVRTMLKFYLCEQLD